MSNGMPSWEEWNGLEEEQRKYSLFKVLTDLYYRECTRDKGCAERLFTCNDHFKKLDKRRWFDRTISVIVGAVTGIGTALGIKIGVP